MQETERKFLVNEQVHQAIEKSEGKQIRQGYIMDGPDGKTVRVRTKGSKGFLTIKGKSVGISRSEYEYEIPLQDAESLLDQFCPVSLSKVRYEVEVGGKTWEIDVFHGKLEGLMVAEIELESEDEAFELPEWAAEEVSHDPGYYNSNLIKRV